MENWRPDEKKVIQWLAAAVIAFVLSFVFGVIQYRFGRFRAVDFWFFSLLGLTMLSYIGLKIVSLAVFQNLESSEKLVTQSPQAQGSPKPLVFRGTDAAFEYACKHTSTDLKKGSTIPALVIDAKEFAGTAESVKRDANGIQSVVLKVASDDGGFVVMAQTAGPDTEDLAPGDFVAWRAFQFMEGMSDRLGDSRFAWVGLVVAKLKPELDPYKGWRIAKRFQ